jgi:hypothetical protein
VNMVMNLRFPQNTGYLLTSWATISFSRSTLVHAVSKITWQPRENLSIIRRQLTVHYMWYGGRLLAYNHLHVILVTFCSLYPDTMQDSKFSRRQRFKSRSSGLLGRGVKWSAPEDGGNNVLRNVGILPQHYTVSQPRRPRLEVHADMFWTTFITSYQSRQQMFHIKSF